MSLLREKLSFDTFCIYIFESLIKAPLLEYETYTNVVKNTTLDNGEYEWLLGDVPAIRCVLASVKIYGDIERDTIKLSRKELSWARLESNLNKSLENIDMEQVRIELFMDVYNMILSDIFKYRAEHEESADILSDSLNPIAEILYEEGMLDNRKLEYHNYVSAEARNVNNYCNFELKRFKLIDFTEDNKIENQEIRVAFTFKPENSYVSGDRKISEYDDEILISLLTVFIARFLYVSKKSEFQIFKNHLLNYFENFLSIENQSDVKLQDQLLNTIHSQFETDEHLAYRLMCETYSFPPEDIYEDDLNRSTMTIINANDYVLTLNISSAYTMKKIFSNNIRKINKVGLNLKMPQQEGINKIYLPVILKYLTKEVIANVSDLESAQKAIILFLKSVNSRNFIEYVLVNKALQKAEIF